MILSRVACTTHEKQTRSWDSALSRSSSARLHFSASSRNSAHPGAERFVVFRCGGFRAASFTTYAMTVFASLQWCIKAESQAFGEAASSTCCLTQPWPNKSLQPTVTPLRELPSAELRRYAVIGGRGA